jgi:predicted glycoside hydrolase/deacetylase ChbG (UPF0249 family)
MSQVVKRRLIVNADDLGMSRDVNDAIFALMDDRAVTSSTLMAHGEAIAEAAATLRRFPRCSFGAHLTLTFGRPLSGAAGLESLLDSAGCFTAKIFDGPISREAKAAVAREWIHQVETLMRLEVPLSHLDSHEHVHTLPWLFGPFKAVQRRFGIRRARLSKNVYCSDLPPASPLLLIKKAIWNSALRHHYSTTTTRWFSDFYSINRSAHEGSLGMGTIEAMIHPGPTTDPIATTELAEIREGALAALPFEVQMISYNDL